MKTKSLIPSFFSLILIVLISLSFIQICFCESGYNEVYDTFSTTYGTCIDYSYNSGVYFVDDTYWVFGVWAQFLVCYYSYDNVTWYEVNGGVSSGQIATLTISGSAAGGSLDTYFDGEYFYYAYLQPDGGGNIIFRKGNLNSNGTITWLTAQQKELVPVGANCYYLDMCVDSNGYAWFGFESYSPYNKYTVFKNENNDGTLSLSSVYNITSVSHGYDKGQLTVGSSGLVYLTLANNSVISIYSNADDFGSSLGSVSDTLKTFQSFCSQTYNNTLHIAYLNDADQICYVKYQDSVLSNITVLENVSSTSNPVLSIDTVTYDFYVFWCEGNYGKYIRYDYSEDSFGSEQVYTVELTDIYQNNKLQIMDRDYDNSLGMIFLTGASGETVSYVDLRLNALRTFVGLAVVDPTVEYIDYMIDFSVYLLLLFIPAVIGYYFAHAVGFIAGLNFGVLLIVLLLGVSEYALVVMGIVDVMLFFGGRR